MDEFYSEDKFAWLLIQTHARLLIIILPFVNLDLAKRSDKTSDQNCKFIDRTIAFIKDNDESEHIKTVVEKSNCPFTESECLDQSFHKPERYQRNAVLKVTPKIQVPQELTNSVDTGFTIALPIQVKFQSQIELMSDWVKQFVATKAKGLTKNINTFSASLTQLLGLLNARTNGGPNSSEPPFGQSSSGAQHNVFATHSTPNTGTDSDTSSAHSSESNLVDNSSKRKDSPKDVHKNQFGDNSRIKARNILYKSVEISHSTLGKSCLLRAVCEVSQTPLLAPETGIVGEIIDMFLTINSFHKMFADFEDYINAQTVGRNSFLKQSKINAQNTTFLDECLLYYGKDCPFSLFNINHIIPLNV